MRLAIVPLATALIVIASSAVAQPMSGSFTVGGTSPNFATLQEAADALGARGVSGPVTINIRPGTYSRDGGATTVLNLGDAIPGTSVANRVTFRPDAAAGGNVNNVILSADFNATSAPRTLVVIRADFVTLRSLTLKDTDVQDAPAFALVQTSGGFVNPQIDGLEIHFCRFAGTPYFPDFGSDIGIWADQTLMTASFTHNRFDRLCRGITNVNSGPGGTIAVADNEFHAGYTHNGLGTAIDLAAAHASIRRNLIDLAGGLAGQSGIELVFPRSAVIERNVIKNRVPVGGPFDTFRGISIRNSTVVDSIVVVNNAVVAIASQDCHCIVAETPNTRILFNTLVNAGGGGVSNFAVSVTGGNCTVLNNIILEVSSASFVAFDQGYPGQAANLVSDYNILYLPDGHGSFGLVRRDGVTIASLAGWQAAGFDLHSFNQPVVFVDEFHLDGCQAQDPALNGTPIPGIITDFDNQLRDAIIPMKGADETERASYDMFGAGFRAALSGTPFSLVAGDFDGDQDDDIAIPDYDNHRVSLFRNQGGSRSFVNFGTIFTTVPPTVLELFDWDRDGNKDLIVAGDTSAVQVFWGDASGSFGGGSSIVGTAGRVRSIASEPYVARAGDGAATLWVTEDDGFVPDHGFLAFISCFAGRNLCHDITADNAAQFRDTIPHAVSALVVAELHPPAPGYEIVALGMASAGLYEFTDVDDWLYGVPPFVGPCDPIFGVTRVEHQFGTAPYLGFDSNIAVGDFDGDSDPDLITTSAFENGLILVHNLGESLGAPDTIPSTQTRAVVALDYEGDGDLDVVAANRTLEEFGITVFLNDGVGNFIAKPNCFFPFASGFPNGMIASDFDRDGKPDLAIASSFDSLFVVYNLGGSGVPVGVGDRREPASGTIALAQNIPNPFGPSTRIQYTLPAKSHVTLRIYSVLGQVIATLADEEQSPGSHSVTWTGSTTRGARVGAGVYFYRLEAKEPNGTVRLAGAKRMIVLR